ncbi:MAG: hypothetical protein ACYC46_08975 [Acidobacteriaceae bacterium]
MRHAVVQQAAGVFAKYLILWNERAAPAYIRNRDSRQEDERSVLLEKELNSQQAQPFVSNKQMVDAGMDRNLFIHPSQTE